MIAELRDPLAIPVLPSRLPRGPPVNSPKPFQPRPVILEGTHARVEPLAPEHAPDLLEAGAESEIWRYLPRPEFRDLDDVLGWIAEASEECEAGVTVPLAIIQKATDRAVGSTRLYDFQPAERALEIGWTWLGREARRSAINSEVKLLLLRHAFEELGAGRVQLKTDARNLRSQTAIERLGARREGVIRHHRLCWDGHVRDTVYFGILASEWPQLRERLEGFLAR